MHPSSFPAILERDSVDDAGIVRVARHQVDVRVINGLPGGFATVNNHVETGRRMTLLKALLEGSQEFEATLIALKRACKNTLNMDGGDDQ